MSSETIEIKIFVGNVPFQCVQEEFNMCFKNVPGFVSAEIVTRHNSSYSRGFGFVAMSNMSDAKKLIERNDIMFKDRILRFTEYNFQDKSRVVRQNKNYLFVRNVSKEMNREQLKIIFQQYGTVGACFINTNIRTGEPRGNAVVEIKDDTQFERLLEEKYIQTPNGETFEISRWRNKNQNPKVKLSPSKKEKTQVGNRIDSKEIYRIAFNAGVNVGRLEGLKIAKKGA
ncbi:MAG: RNA recognition motif protein [Hyperionvirus sp.]|uniref:RNA recognition motif protein n=1 Tax=Hyperionvirus sp. TaxID=2487770 RepID=A0A3G5AB83_9VIRU|nr:MAG: RNA recognition motif protein [Hyperionvirus sp.]